jgi:DNA-binding transcriptional LysR family regulator
VRLPELTGQPFIMRERGSGTRKITEEALRERGLDPARLQVVLEVTSNEAVRQALKAGAGLAVISRRAIEDDIRYKQLSVLRVPTLRLTREFFLVTHKSRSRSPLAAAFLLFLRQAGKPGGQ